MSLLLEALKKAELAKQQGTASQPPDSAAPHPDPGSSGLALEPGPADVAERPLITRDRLPDITQPLEILSEDLPSAGVRREAPAPSVPPVSMSAPPPVGAGAAERASDAELEEQDRVSARQLFEAKDMDYNPRRPFFIAMGVLGVAVVGVLGYFLYQIYAPRPSFYTGPSAGTKPAPIAAAPAPSAPPAASAPATATPGTQPAAASPAPSAAPAPATGGAAPAAPQPGPPAAATRPTPGGEATRRPTRATPEDAVAETPPAPPRAAAPAAPTIKVTRVEPRVDPGLERGWQALTAGNLALAKDEYLRVLAANPLDRDALLGLATIDAWSQDYESAETRYLKVLELDPRDPYAQAGIIALRGQTDPLLSETRLKNLIAVQPEATFLSFALGNQYALQGRWQDAQSAYFRAFSAEPEHPDYAYNLAVSLDHLRQPKLALEYYQRSLTLARNRAVGFNSALVEARVRELAR